MISSLKTILWGIHDWSEKCCLGLRVCLGCHVGPLCLLMIGRCFVPWIQRCVFPPFLLKFLHSFIFRGHVELTLF
jgi:hypothetical protein